MPQLRSVIGQCLTPHAVRGLLALLSLLALSAGCWMAWAPLGLICPGAIVFAALSWSHLRGE